MSIAGYLPKKGRKRRIWMLQPGFYILISLVCLHSSQAQTTEENGDIKITLEPTPYTIKFSVDEPDKYEIINVTCRNSKNVDETTNDDGTICENLEPCTTYAATVIIRVLEDESEEAVNIDAATAYVEPVVEIVDIIPFEEQINLSWKATDKACIGGYKVQVIGGKNYERDLLKDTTDLNITSLQPCQDHKITLNTTDVNNKLISSLTNTSRTERIEPGEVTNVVIDTTYESGHAKVSWNRPDYFTCIEYYYIKWSTKDCAPERRAEQSGNETTSETENPDDGTCSWNLRIDNFNVQEQTIKDLHGCETYELAIYIDNEITPSSDTFEFTAMEEVPGAVSPLPSESYASAVTLHWTLPKTNAKCVKSYLVYVIGPSQKEQKVFDTNTEDLNATFDGLDPCGSYTYSVQPVSLNGTQGDKMNSNFETREDNPSAVLNLELHPSSNSLDVSWSEPTYANLCIKDYRLGLWKNGKGQTDPRDINTPDTKAHIDDLMSCQSYTVQIIAVTKDANDGQPVQMETETTAQVPGQPSEPLVTSRFYDGIELSVTYYSDSNCETIFASFKCEPKDDAEREIKKSAEKTVEGKLSGSSFKALLSPLSPFTTYTCGVKLYNVAGFGPERKTIGVVTNQYYADVPEDISLSAKSARSLTFTWKEPKFPNGKITVYLWYFQLVRPEYIVPPQCPPVKADPDRDESSAQQREFSKLEPYTRYSLQVSAKNEYGIGEYSRPFMVITDPEVSEPVRHIKITPQGPYETDEAYQANVLVSWTIPCRSNGKISRFELAFSGTRGDQTDDFEHDLHVRSDTIDEYGIVVYNETRIKPDFNYRVKIAVRNVGVDALSREEAESFEAPAGIPKRFNESTADRARVSVFVADNPTNSAVVRFPAYILESDSGEIVYGALLLSQKGCNEEPPLVYGALVTKDFWPDSRKWSDVYNDEAISHCVPQYQTTKMRWEPKSSTVGDEIQYTIGIEACSDEDNSYCNGPLKPDTEYFLVIRLFTKSGFNDAILLDFRTESLIQLELILISVSCCLLLALFGGLAYIYMKKRSQWKRQSCHDIEDPFGDILAKNFATYYNEISRPERIAREFKELTMVAMEFSYSASELGVSKNRYTDIYPYDKNRVILDIDADGSDYINASFIDGYRQKKQYIATQGPKPESTLDFWRMILQHNIRVIVMLTQFMENDIVKCHEYFPYQSQGINVTVKKKESFELYDRSEMSVTHERYGLKEKVVHFYFKKWPDHGVPVDPAHLIAFLRKVKSEKVPSYSSIVVHCSAGVGRTGTFIGLDVIMQRIRNESKINIYGTVKKLRFQRMKMVQTLDQYTFLYKCAYELVKHKDQRNKMKKNGQKVSFQNDAEANTISSTVSTLPSGRGSINNGRLVPMQLSSIPELEHENASEVSTSNGNLNRDRPYLRLNYGSSPALANGFTKSNDSSHESIM